MIVAEKITSNVISSKVEAHANDMSIEEEINIVDDPDDRMCGHNLFFCHDHLRCESLPAGVDKSQLPSDVTCSNIENVIDDEAPPGKVWDAEAGDFVPIKKKKESGIKKICLRCGGVMKNAL